MPPSLTICAGLLALEKGLLLSSIEAFSNGIHCLGALTIGMHISFADTYWPTQSDTKGMYRLITFPPQVM